MENRADIIIVGAGLAGLAAAAEAAEKGKTVFLVDQEGSQSLGGQAFWSFGGLFLVDTPEQRRLGVRDSRALAWQDWLGAAGFDRNEDERPRKWAEAYVDFAAHEKRAWLDSLGLRFVKVVGWAERGGYLATGHGNSVPRFHIVWGTGPGILAPFIGKVLNLQRKGLVSFCFRHKATALIVENGTVKGVRGQILEPTEVKRGFKTSRTPIGEFSLYGQAVIIASGGIGGNHDLVRQFWPSRLGPPPKKMLSGVPDYVDGSLLRPVSEAGGRLINMDRMWHYPEGLHNFAPIWSRHGIRILCGPTPLWLDAKGSRLPPPLFPGFDAHGALAHINRSGYGHSWFLLNQKIIEKEFALSGSEQNPDLTSGNLLSFFKRALPGAPKPVARFQEKGVDFITDRHLGSLVEKMNALTGEELIDLETLEREVTARDREVSSGLGKDAQLAAIHSARRYWGDRLLRVSAVDTILNPKHGPLIAVRLSILTRKTLGGFETDLSGRVLLPDGAPLPGLYAAGEAAGFGGGGMHGYRSLEGTFLGGCLFSGRACGRSAAKAIV